MRFLGVNPQYGHFKKSLFITDFLLFQIFASQKKMPVARFHKLVTNFFRLMSVVMIPIAATVPSVSTEGTSGASPVAGLFWCLKDSPKASRVSYFYCCVVKKNQMFCLCVCLNLVALGIFLFKEEDFANLKGVHVLCVVCKRREKLYVKTHKQMFVNWKPV